MSPFPGSAPRTDEWRHLCLTTDDGVATVTLDRPERLDALTFGACVDLRDLLAGLSRERRVRALVLAGEGRGFCSGGDVDEITGVPLAPFSPLRVHRRAGGNAGASPSPCAGGRARTR